MREDKERRRPILCLDFDGVVHSYRSGWKGAEVVPDMPVPGAMEFMRQALTMFRVAIYSSRSSSEAGISAMKQWVERHARQARFDGHEWWLKIEWPTNKPSAFVTIDDRAITFNGVWPDLGGLYNFKTWWERAPTETVRGAAE